ncbi:hypothetical protein H7F51_03725 [Novosphingobium flavum]|uniref:asparagine synthase (glutamine-hydrolyzing) n=1 Tax=Novosphingobium flavum TaxID=1778672 RepID=A0A7X1FPK2_9SPHN|nr:asparagine synthase-related protein [Novosphingobium flavum]MBC2664626.1 hypothetical protein [Novosphingobium flavum]
MHGWLDDLDTLIEELGAEAHGAGRNPARLYDLALSRWGDETDLKLTGTYAAITSLGDGRLRLARSPWSAPPLHFVHSAERAMASSVIRVLFEAGHPREVDYEFVADQLVQDHRPLQTVGWYRGVSRVPIGTRIVLSAKGAEITPYYDPHRVTPVHLPRDEDYVAAAHDLLARSARLALQDCRRPGLMLSGGLDSAMCATALLGELPSERRLATFTFCPDPAWDGRNQSTQFGNERPYVEAFAAMHPRIDAMFDNTGQFDTGLRDILRANDLPTANVANTGKYHGPWQMARTAGCDWLFNAEFGNFTISNDGRWSYVEYLKRGKWRQLAKALAQRGGDGRPLWRKVLALSILPLVPRRLRVALRRLVHPGDGDPVSNVSGLSPAARAAQAERARERGTDALMDDYHYPRSRAEFIARIWESADSGEDLDLAFERLYGIRRRDITAHRPLIEFCLGVPTRQYIHEGVDRWLARRMAEGRIPEKQRTERRQGNHHPDWHVQLGRRRAELAESLERLRDHPVLGEMLDIDRLNGLLEDWPEVAPLDKAQALPRAFAMTRALTAASFVCYAEGRNDF